jgi:hypothetical protein
MVLFGLTSAAAVTGTATADPEPYTLKYRAAAGCPGEAQLRGDVAAHVRGGLRPSGVRLEIQIVAAHGRFQGDLLATDRLGSEDRQVLGGEDCAEIAHALAFLAGVAIELGERRAVAPPPPPIAPPPSSAPTAPRARAVRFTGGLLGGVMGGLADGPSPTGELVIGVEDARDRRVALGVEAAVLVAGDRPIESPRGSAELSLLGGRLAACPLRLKRWLIDLRPCAGVTFGTVWGRATSLANAPSVVERWASAEATAAVRLFLPSGVFAEVEGGAIFPFVRPSYTFQFQPDGQPLYAVPRVTGRASLGAGFGF